MGSGGATDRHCVTHLTPSKHWPVGHSHTSIETLSFALQPHAPTAHVFGNRARDEADLQHDALTIVPPASVHSADDGTLSQANNPAASATATCLFMRHLPCPQARHVKRCQGSPQQR